MTYRYDADLAEAAGNFGVFDLTEPPRTRATLIAAGAARPAPDTTGVEVTDLEAPGPEDNPRVPVRIYRPAGTTDDLPAVLNIHGGGFVIGRIEVDDDTCLDIARRAGAVVVSVGYRLAPEHPYPAGLQDCYAVLEWLAARAGELRVDADRIAVHGISAGGGLAAAVALLARDRGGPKLAFQYLDLPELDDRRTTLSMARFTDTPGWNTPNAEISWHHYLGERAGADDVPVYAAPGRAKDLSDLPPAYVTALEYDPCRDEAVAYAESLFAAGVPVETHVFSGAYHLAYLIPTAKVSLRRAEERITVLRTALHG
ncbi:alpha/beta hydrolase [Streptomyces sp. NRRL S-646]|uniref:alpha/beta hydrolase n=1 Tax=Streptomyces sp. NRRL S-646 TaxID=1463917 RepID=UPI0004C81E0A|nr:alpha/beta hydrolase [Streptomyces sp. NRRL S-646]